MDMRIIKSRKLFLRGMHELPKGTGNQWFAESVIHCVDDALDRLKQTAAEHDVAISNGDRLAEIEEALFAMISATNPEETALLTEAVGRLDPDA